MNLRLVGPETVELLERGAYIAPSGRTVAIGDLVERARRATTLHSPSEVAALVARGPGAPCAAPAAIEVTSETTSVAARRLGPAVVALNFASAKNPGGGFLGGARAQEEALARASGLYACLRAAPRYYAANRSCDDALYTDWLIHSREVPFFRDDDHRLLEEPFVASIITSPAPNTGAARGEAPGRIRETFERRAAHVLAVAEAHGHRALVLGAWGCGAFRGDPTVVADVFARLLGSPRFERAFERVTFAVFEPRGEGPNLQAFRARFASMSAGRDRAGPRVART